jgi:hypothetical protein
LSDDDDTDFSFDIRRLAVAQLNGISPARLDRQR